MISEIIQDLQPDIPLLQWLARGSLKQNLLRAIRLWVWLRFLYTTDRLPQTFSYFHWRDVFFSPDHPKGEKRNGCQNFQCNCGKTTEEWLFESALKLDKAAWIEALQQHDKIEPMKIEQMLTKRLFTITNRSLLEDLHILSELGFLKRQKQEYSLVSELPLFLAKNNSQITGKSDDKYYFWNNEDLEFLAKNQWSSVGNNQRFFFYVDYVISNKHIDRIDDIQVELKEIWEAKIILPIQFTYYSVKYGKKQCIVYPVCLCYCQRAVYLCALGINPQGSENWYNYRLDRIFDLKSLQWDEQSIPKSLQELKQQQKLPIPTDIESKISEAWGFDFYETKLLMLLRFDRNFHANYIKDTYRHDTFKKITYEKAQDLIRKSANSEHLLKILQSRSPNDAYYQVYYRENDPNVGLRLCSWRHNVEVLLPWSLRQKIAEESRATMELYHKESSENRDARSNS